MKKRCCTATAVRVFRCVRDARVGVERWDDFDAIAGRSGLRVRGRSMLEY